MEYWSQNKIDTILKELDIYYSKLTVDKLEKIKHSYTSTTLNKDELLAISMEVIKGYKEVDAETDGIINTFTEEEFQSLVTNIYEHFPTIKK